MIHCVPADPADVRSLARMRNEAEPASAADARMLAYLRGDHHPRHALGPRAMFIALDGEVRVGYIAGHLTQRFDCDGELQYLYVLPSYRRRGVAAALLLELAAWFVVQGGQRICVDVGNEGARRFYQRQGATDLRPHWMVWEEIGEVVRTPRSWSQPSR